MNNSAGLEAHTNRTAPAAEHNVEGNGQDLTDDRRSGYLGEIVYPRTQRIEVGPDVAFIYIVRDDTKTTFEPIAEAVRKDTLRLDKEAILSAFKEEYVKFFRHLSNSLLHAFAKTEEEARGPSAEASGRNKIQIHILSPEPLERGIKELAQGLAIVSLDPLLEGDGIEHFAVSRAYCLGGKKHLGATARPGFPSREEQREELAKRLQGRGVLLADDDLFSGQTAMDAVHALKDHLNIHGLAFGIQVGQMTADNPLDAPVNAVIQYTMDPTQGDIFRHVDLGDYRDFIIGASGLVTRLPNGREGRLPYILPFVSPAARVGVPVGYEREFSIEVLNINHTFFSAVEEKIGVPVLVKHMDPGFREILHQMYGISDDTRMTSIVNWARNNLDSIWLRNREIGQLQHELHGMRLADNLALIDLNGTLIPEDQTHNNIPAPFVAQVRDQVDRLARAGMQVGLCSDSPIDGLREYAKRFGFNGPVVGENGNIIWKDDQHVILREIPGIGGLGERARLLDVIQQASDQLGEQFERVPDCRPPHFARPGEFNKFPDYSKNEWAFDRGLTDGGVGIFGPQPLLDTVDAFLSNHPSYRDRNGHQTVQYLRDSNYLRVNPYVRDEIIAAVDEFAKSSGTHLRQLNDCAAPEFGGAYPNFTAGEWAFGSGRHTSLSVFGPQSLIHFLGDRFKDYPNCSVDCSPEVNYFGLHPGPDFRQAKGETLQMLSQFGRNVLMIGNSMSDWVEPKSGVLCAFVGDCRISNEAREQAAYVSPVPQIHGVVDILKAIKLPEAKHPARR